MDELNEELLEAFPGEERLYSSANSVKGVEDEEHHYPEFYQHRWPSSLSTKDQAWSAIDAVAEFVCGPWSVQWNQALSG